MGINLPDLPWGNTGLAFKQVNTGLVYNDKQGDVHPHAWMKENYNWSILALYTTPNIIADLTFFVDINIGSDDNDGLTITTPFRTIQKAVDTCQAHKANKYAFTINIAAGTYEEDVAVLNTQQNSVGSPYDIRFLGTGSVILSSDTCFFFQGSCRCKLTNLSLSAATIAIYATEGATVYLDNLVFLPFSTNHTSLYHISANKYASVFITSPYSIQGNGASNQVATNHINCAYNSIVEVENYTQTPYSITLTNTPAFEHFVRVTDQSTVSLPSMQIAYSGASAGKQCFRQPTSNFYFSNNLPSGLSPCELDVTYLGETYATTPSDPLDSSTRVPTTEWVMNNEFLVPTGAVILYASSSPPTGYQPCDGRELSRTTYAKLFSVIGTTWGSPSSSTVFKLPNARDRMVRCSGSTYTFAGTSGSDSISLVTANIPSHNHSVSVSYSSNTVSVPITVPGQTISSSGTISVSGTTNEVDASSTSGGGGGLTSHTVPSGTVSSAASAAGVVDFTNSGGIPRGIGFEFNAIDDVPNNKSMTNYLHSIDYRWAMVWGKFVDNVSNDTHPYVYSLGHQHAADYSAGIVPVGGQGWLFQSVPGSGEAFGPWEQSGEGFFDDDKLSFTNLAQFAMYGGNNQWPFNGTGANPPRVWPLLIYWRSGVGTSATGSLTSAGASFINQIRTQADSNGGSSFSSSGSGSSLHSHTVTASGTFTATGTTPTQTLSSTITLPTLNVSQQNIGSGSSFSVANSAIHLFAMIKH